MSEIHEATWLTQQAYDRLADELEYLVTIARGDIAKRIQEAREEGDLKENGGYHAAKEEQGKIESRINRIEEILATAKVGEPPKAHGIVQQGLVITVDLNGSEKKFLLGSAEITDDSVEVYSPDSPIGSAILGKSVGEVLEVALPNGKTIKVKILDVANS